jgi:oligopeptide transport system ATP-binding protein
MTGATATGRKADNVIVVESVARHFAPRARWFWSKRGLPIRAVDGVSFAVPRGSSFAIVGESGSGKSTLARLVVGLLRPTDGAILLDGEPLGDKTDAELRHLRRKVQLVLQDPLASLDPRMKIYAILREALVVHDLHRGAEQQRQRIESVIRQVGLGVDHLSRYPNELSGGQRQRVAIARAIICEPEVLVLDEPVSALDVSVQAQIVNLLVELQEKLNLTYVLISHDLALVAHMADAIGVMYLGRLVEIGPASTVCRTPAHPYTESLMAVVASHDPAVERSRKIEIIQGSVPSAATIPPGCSFHTRCPRARAVARSMTTAETMESENGRIPSICMREQPAPRPVGQDDVIATCHFAAAGASDVSPCTPVN